MIYDVFHNTTNESGDTLRECQKRASTQEDKILRYFRANWHTEISPSRVQRYVMQNAPITSVRRAITNLTKRGFLEKTDKKVPGAYGRNEFCWRLAGDEQGELF